MWVVLAIPVPRIPGKTERLYASLKSGHYTDGQITDRFITTLTGGRKITSSMLFNVFESVAFDMFDRLREYREQFLKAGAESVHLAGSGPALFTLVKDKLQADKIYQGLRRQGLESYLAETLASVDQAELPVE
jgi:4-diphosphocytidyl-2-C-methyl-D-erythritol kinase